MKIKKPSLKGVKSCEYLGHFAQDKYIQAGHNDLIVDDSEMPFAVMKDDSSAIRGAETKTFRKKYLESRKSSGKLNQYQAEELSTLDEEKSESKSETRSGDRYDWETTVKNGKRSHRLIRR